MKSVALFATAALLTIAIADPLFDENVFEIFSIHTTRSSAPQTLAGGLGLLKRATCETTCSNGGCCNSGGPCTTDGMCCLSGEFACTDGGCCASGATCATVNGTQVCQSTVSCKAPIVICGSACCDAGTECVTVGTQFRCEPGNSSTPTTTSQAAAAPTPQLGDGHRSSTISRLTTPTYDLSSVTASTTSGTGASTAGAEPTTSSVKLTAGAKSSSSSSSGSMQAIFVSDMRFAVNVLGAVFVGAAFLLIN